MNLRKSFNFVTNKLVTMIDKENLFKEAKLAFSNGHISNYWHFYTDGKSVEFFFPDDDSFRAGMELTSRLSAEFEVLILAFVLMDTHIHFILYGDLSECQRFMHKYIKMHSMYLSYNNKMMKCLRNCLTEYQAVEDYTFLKTVIAYVLRNPCVARMPYLLYDYPWGSAALYFRREKVHLLEWKGITSPYEYVTVPFVERIYGTPKAFFFFIGRNKEDEVETNGGTLSNVSISLSEMRVHKKELCKEMFGTENVKRLDLLQRMALARALKSKYRCSEKMANLLVAVSTNPKNTFDDKTR